MGRNILKKKDQNNYFRAEISQKEEQLLKLKVKKNDWFFNNKENLLLFLKSNFYKSKFANTYMSYEKLAIAFDINTLKLF